MCNEGYKGYDCSQLISTTDMNAGSDATQPAHGSNGFIVVVILLGLIVLLLLGGIAGFFYYKKKQHPTRFDRLDLMEEDDGQEMQVT